LGGFCLRPDFVNYAHLADNAQSHTQLDRHPYRPIPGFDRGYGTAQFIHTGSRRRGIVHLFLWRKRSFSGNISRSGCASVVGRYHSFHQQPSDRPGTGCHHPLLVGVTTYISVRAGNEIEAQALRNLEQNNKSLTTNISTWLDLYGRAVQEMAMLPDIKSMYAVRQKPVLLAVARAYPNLFLVHTTDLTGKNVARNDDEEPKEYGDRAWFLGAKAGTLVTYEALISRTTGQPALNMAAPIYDNSGKIVGVASITSELTDISKEVLSAEEGRGITYVVDANNRVVSHPDPSYTEGELRDLSAYPPVVALREGKTGKFTFTDENGVVWVAYVNRLNNNWGIVAQQTEAELLAPVRQFETVSIILILIGSG